MSDRKFPDPKEIQKDIEKFIKEKFGGNVQFMAQVQDQTDGYTEPQKSSIKDLGAKAKKEKNEISFDQRPKDIKGYLDRFVIGQDDAKKALAIAVCDHYNHVMECQEDPSLAQKHYNKQNVLLLGPTGVGKTYLVKKMAELIGVPFVKADATRFTETGYVGANVDDIIKDLVNAADGDLDLAQFGIVYLDEADKLAGNREMNGRDPAGRGVQFGLLKLMEETEVDLRSGHDMMSQLQNFMDFQKEGKLKDRVINTKHILFIVSGAFGGLENVISKRLKTRRIGLTQSETKRDEVDHLFSQVATNDLIEYGLEPEFIGRLPVRVACHHLSEDNLFQVMKESEDSLISQYVSSFGGFDIEAKFQDSSLRAVAKLASVEKTGARALMTVCEKIFRDFKYELPSYAPLELEINEDLINRPEETLEKIVGQQEEVGGEEFDEFSQNFLEQHGMNLSFSPKARRMIFQQSKGSSVMKFCQKLLTGYEHGLKLIQQNTKKSSFVVDENVVARPVETLERWIRDSYGSR